MEELLYKQADILALLKERGLASFNKASFSEAVTRGKIPFIQEEGSTRKMYSFDAVAKAIKKAGIGHSKKAAAQLSSAVDLLPEPRDDQSPEDYEQEVRELGLNPTLTDVNIYKTLYTGKLEKLKYEREMGEVMSRRLIEDTSFKVARTIRDRFLTIPERLSNELASMSDAHLIKETLFKEIGNILEDLSNESFYEDN